MNKFKSTVNKIKNTNYKPSQMRLSEIVKFSRGKNITSEEMEPGEYDVISAGVHPSGTHDKMNVSGPSITISASGANAGIVLFHKNNIWAADCLYSTYNSNIKFNRYFLNYLQPVITNLQRGAAQPHVYYKDVNRLKVEVPSCEVQEKISKLLTKYDDLIDNNIKRISLLNKLCDEIFKEWFVRFRYPTSKSLKFKKCKIGMIPEQFNLTVFSTIINDYIGGGWGEDNYSEFYSEGAYVIRGADFPYITNGDLSSCPYRFHKKSNYKVRSLRENDVLMEISGGTEDEPVGRTIYVTKDVLKQMNNKVICASFCKLIRPNLDKITINYFYHWLKYMHKTRMLDKFQVQSTGISNFKFEYFLRKGECLLPPKELMLSFEKHIQPIKNKIDILSGINQNLIKQKDIIMSKVIPGFVDITKMEIV